MKELLEELGFKDENGVYLPMLSEFVKACDSLKWIDSRRIEGEDASYTHSLALAKFSDRINQYTDLIAQPLTKGNVKYWFPAYHTYETIEQAINNGIKLYLK
jgi:hypothetical protein